MAARNFRRGKGSDSKTTDDTKISNSVSASDGRSEDALVPPPPRPVQPRKGGRTDLSPQQGSQLHQQMHSATTPQMSRREQKKLDAMRNPAPAPVVAAAAVPTMGGAGSENPQGYVSPTDEQLKAYARQSVDDYNAGIEQADQISWLNDADMARLDDAVAFEMAVDAYRGNVEQAATDLTQVDLNSLSVEGHAVTRGGLTYSGKEGLIVVDNGLSKIEPGKEDPRPRLDLVDVQSAIAAREAAEQQQSWEQNPDSVHEERHAVFFSMGDTRIQFSDSSPWQRVSEEKIDDLRRDLVLNGQEAIAERLHVDIQTPEERAVELTQALDAPRHEAAYRELTGDEFPSSTPMSVEDQKAIVDAYETAPAVARQPAVQADRPQTPEEKQASADQMFAEGKELRDIHAHTGTKPEGADQAAWEKTEFVYGQPTALDRLQDMGRGGHAVSESGYTYAMSADGKELIRFDADLKEAGRKSVDDVQAYLHEKRGVEFDKQQEQKQAEVEALPTHEEERWSQTEYDEKQEGYYQEQKDAEEVAYQQQETLDQSKEYAEAAVEDMNQTASQPMTDSQKETAALLQGGQKAEAQQQAVDAAPQEKVEVQPEQSAEDYQGLGSHFVSGPIYDRMDELKPEFDAKDLTTEQWGEAYGSSRQDLQQWDGENVEQYFDLHARAELSAEKAGIDPEIRLENREDDIYAMSPGAKAELDNLGVDFDNLERAVEWRKSEEQQAETQQEQAVEPAAQEEAKAAPEQSAAVEKEPAGELAQKDHALSNAEQLPDAPGKATAQEFAKDTSEDVAKAKDTAVSMEVSKGNAEVKSELQNEQDAKVNADAHPDLRADFLQSKSAFEAKQPEKAPAQEVAVTAEVQQQAGNEPNADLRSDFAQSKAAFDAKQEMQPEQKVEEAEKAETSEKVSNEPNADLRADFEHSKAAFEEKQAQPEPEQSVQYEQEEERRRGLEAA